MRNKHYERVARINDSPAYFLVLFRHILKLEVIKKGKSYYALCPLHKEKTPSFCIYNAYGFWAYKCFGCGQKGMIFKLIKELGLIKKFDPQLCADKDYFDKSKIESAYEFRLALKYVEKELEPKRHLEEIRQTKLEFKS